MNICRKILLPEKTKTKQKNKLLSVISAFGAQPQGKGSVFLLDDQGGFI